MNEPIKVPGDEILERAPSSEDFARQKETRIKSINDKLEKMQDLLGMR